MCCFDLTSALWCLISHVSLFSDIADHDEDSKKKEEKKRAVKSLIEKIPTGKEELFNYTVDWDAVDSVSSDGGGAWLVWGVVS